MKTRIKLCTGALLISFALAGCHSPESGRQDSVVDIHPEEPSPRIAAEESEADGRNIRRMERDRVAGDVATSGITGGAHDNTIEHNREAYDRIYENNFLAAIDHPLSTFSVDVDTASYSIVRRFLNNGQRPPADAVRVEELINYFDYDYEAPTDGRPFAVHSELAECPWNPNHRLLQIGIQAQTIPEGETPPRNLVFLLDVSGSMNNANKLPLLKRAMIMLTNQMNENDRIAIVVYAGASGLVLPPTSGENTAKIREALERLSAGGSTNGGAGIELAYDIARRNFNEEGINRVILATDGDFNVGTTSQGDLIRMIEEKRENGIFLTVLGFGSGNLQDSTMEKLADRGNGNYAYIDNVSEARKVLVTEAGSTLVTVAKDVKLQLEFNPEHVAAYRLIGYENRMLEAQDFNDDEKDAGEIGAGHTVTALYEIVPRGVDIDSGNIDELRYQTTRETTSAANSGELAHVKIRYKEPEGDTSELLSFPIAATATDLEDTSPNFRFSAAVAAYGMLLRDSEHKGDASFELVSDLASNAMADDREGYRAEFLRLASMARDMM